ncbi:MAG TPA: tRNA (N6-isopentenyl adenosine(37)-C2)-methylthiotransferase MiaB [Thermoanaerobaculia bacterium]|nr:tRNA (N6-isopentenyl adenosine(37)-C2)-methylthiotransferase MiaB [Thermoanaerobaculia bacterium]
MDPLTDGGAMKFHVETWGCQMNVLDSQRMAGLLESRGLSSTEDPFDADVLLLNTCDVREKAEGKVYSELGRFAAWKREKAGRVIGVTGCVAQRAGLKILDRMPYVDFVLGTGNVEKVPEAIEEALRGRRGALLDLDRDSPVYQFRSIARQSPFQAFVTVIEGCDQFCTFCVVPFTRGRERSRRAAEIEAECRELAGNGFTEITLLGQTVNAYSCPESGADLADLLERLCGIDGVRRLRYITSHPAFVTPGFADVLARHPKIGRYFHLPAQSGSDRILSRMKRRYTAERYREIVADVRARAGDVVFSSDFIVGFPGETEEDFRRTLALVEEIRFGMLFAFLYSARPGTAAARWGAESEVPEEVARERLGRLLDLQRRIQAEAHRELEGSVFDVLVEGASKIGSTLSGRTSCNRIVHFHPRPEHPVRPGEYVPVRIERGLENSLAGSPA